MTVQSMAGPSQKSWRSLLFPLLWEAMFVASCLVVELRDDKRHFTLTLYFMFAFYLGLLLWFRRDFSLRQLVRSFGEGRSFVVPVVLTGVATFAAHGLSEVFCARFFPGAVRIVLPLAFSSTVFETILFAVSVMVLQPIAAELFYRKAWIRLGEGRLLFLLTFFSGLVLEALARSITWPGILETVFLALPLAIAYCVTKNIYVPLFVHLVFNMMNNMADVVYDFMRLALA